MAGADPLDNCGCPPTYGHSHARIFTPPLRDLTPETTLGFAFIYFATMIGLDLHPWQKWLALHALELLPDGRPRFRTIVLLISRQNGKTTWATVLILFWLYYVEKRMIIGAAQSLAMAEEVFDDVVSLSTTHEELAPEVVKVLSVNGKKSLKLTGGRRYLPLAATPSAGRGFSPDGLFFDELREQHDWKAWAALEASQVAQMHGQLLAASNAGDVNAVVLAHLRDSAMLDIKEYNTAETRLALFDFSADPDLDIASLEAMRQGNPSLGYMIEVETIRSKLATLPPGDYKTEHLCLWVESLDSPIDTSAWKHGADAGGSLEAAVEGRRVHVGLEVSADQQQVVLAGAALVDPDAEPATYRLEILRSWSGPDAVQRCATEIEAIINAVQPQTFSWFPGAAGAVLKPIVLTLNVDPIEIRGDEVQAVCQVLSEKVKARRVLHSDDALLNAQVFGAQRAYVGDGWRFQRKYGSPGHVTALYATGAALRQAVLNPPPSFTFIRVGS